MKTRTRLQGNAHGWIAGFASIAAGIALIAIFPALKGISSALLLVGLFHLVGAVVVVGSAVALAPPSVRDAVARFAGRHRQAKIQGLDFGWSAGAMNLLWLVGLALAAIAMGLQLTYPSLWPAWFLIALLAVNSFVGSSLLRTSGNPEWASLPMVNLLSSNHDRVLDAGCGAGRTSIVLSRILKDGRITAFDRFDASYIDGGGQELLKRNLAIAGIADRVSIERGDITAMPFPEATFDSAVSAHAMDHLGEGKRQGLAEVYRVLKPGGRFLMVVWVPGWTAFAMGNVFSFLLTTKRGWRRMAGEAGFTIEDEGLMNGMWWVVLKKGV